MPFIVYAFIAAGKRLGLSERRWPNPTMPSSRRICRRFAAKSAAEGKR